MFKRFLKYAIVGLQISLLYWAIVYVLTEYVGIWYMYSVISTTIATSLFGFVMNSLWTWGGSKQIDVGIVKEIIKGWRNPIGMIKLAWSSRFVRYYFVGGLGILLGWTQTYIYTEFLHLWYILSSFIGTLVVMTTTFIARDKWVWKNENTETA